MKMVWFIWYPLYHWISIVIFAHVVSIDASKKNKNLLFNKQYIFLSFCDDNFVIYNMCASTTTAAANHSLK